MDAFWTFLDSFRFFDLVNVAIAIGALIIAVCEWNEHIFTKRTEKLRAVYTMLSANRRLLTQLLQKHYAKSGLAAQSATLLSKPEWKKILPVTQLKMQPADSEPPVDYSRITQHLRRSGILPNPNRDLATNLLLHTDIRLYDAPSYAIGGVVSREDGLVFRVHPGSYFDYINSCFPFGFEAAEHLLEKRENRPLLLRQNTDPFDFSNRFAQIGMETLVILRGIQTQEGGKPVIRDYFLVHQRSDQVSESRGLLSAVPAGSFQPSCSNFDAPLSQALEEEGILHTIVREFLEEVCDVEEFDYSTDAEQIQKHPMFQTIQANTYYLTSGVNPVNLFFEMTFAMVLQPKDLQWWTGCEDSLTLEHLQALLARSNPEGDIILKPLNTNTLRHFSHHLRAAPAFRTICRILLEQMEAKA